jgi:hypothetical protein
MKRPLHFFAILLFSLTLSIGNAFAADRDEFDKIRYASEIYDDYRKITYWAKFLLTIDDYHYKNEDAEFLKLIVKEKNKTFEKINPNKDINQHFLAEFKRIFQSFNFPFHDTEIGHDERWEKFYQENRKQRESMDKFIEKWKASEVARRRALYGGHPGSIYCHIKVKRRNFPILYEIRCSISAKEDLSYDQWFESKNIGFSSPEHIGGELKTAITEMLKEQSIEMAKIRKYGR